MPKSPPNPIERWSPDRAKILLNTAMQIRNYRTTIETLLASAPIDDATPGFTSSPVTNAKLTAVYDEQTDYLMDRTLEIAQALEDFAELLEGHD